MESLFDPLSSTVDVGEMAGALPWTTNTSEHLAEEIKWKRIKTNQRAQVTLKYSCSQTVLLLIVCL